MADVELDGVKYDPPKPIAWYPEGLGWEISAPKRVVRKQEAFKKFQKFLVGETDVVSHRCHRRGRRPWLIVGKLEQAGGRVDDPALAHGRAAAPPREYLCWQAHGVSSPLRGS